VLKKNAWLVALALVMIAGGRGAGQAITPESLTVVVSDYGGTPIADASVVLTNEATGVTMELRTDASGKCMESLEPGHYKVAVEAPGFAPFRMADLAASAGDTLPV
jgi:translation elongation factor EF-G